MNVLRNAPLGLLALVLWAGGAWGETPAPDVDEAEEPPLDSPYGSVLSVGEQLDPESGSLPGEAGDGELRLRFDRVELERLYRALRASTPEQGRRISLRECIAIALESNQDIQIAAYGPWKAGADVTSAWGQFDPVLSADATYSETRQTASAQTQVFSGGIGALDMESTTAQLSIGGQAPWTGTQYSVGMDLSRDLSTYTGFTPDWSGGLTLTATQPLLRGFGPSATLAHVRSSKIARRQAGQQLEVQVMNSIADVVKAYWDLVGAYENVRVRKESLSNAERLLQQNEQRHEIGSLSGLEVVQAKAGVATRQSDLISARSQVHDAADQLKNLMSLGEDGFLDEAVLVPIDRPSLEEAQLDQAQSIEAALDHRPEIASAQLSVETAELERKRAANDMLPQIDLTGSYNRGGRGPEHEDVFRGIRDRQDSSWSVGVQGQIPLGNRQARGAYQRRKFEMREAEQRLEKTRQDIALAVRMALRHASTSRILVESNRQARALQETNVAAEEKRQKLGASTSFEVLRTQEDLTQAQVNELQSVINYEKALVDLRLAEGLLLEELGIEFEAPEEPEKPISYLRSLVPLIEK